jgi:hypothetical protein
MSGCWWVSTNLAQNQKGCIQTQFRVGYESLERLVTSGGNCTGINMCEGLIGWPQSAQQASPVSKQTNSQKAVKSVVPGSGSGLRLTTSSRMLNELMSCDTTCTAHQMECNLAWARTAAPALQYHLSVTLPTVLQSPPWHATRHRAAIDHIVPMHANLMLSTY